MKKLIILAGLLATLSIASTALAAMICSTLSNGQVVCTEAGGGASSYR